MPGFMMMPEKRRPDTFQLLSNLLMQSLSYQQQEKMFNKESEQRRRLADQKLVFDAQMQGHEVREFEAEKPPKGYIQTPFSSTTFVSKDPTTKPFQPVVAGDGSTLGYSSDGGRTIVQKPKSASNAMIEQYEYGKDNPEFNEWRKNIAKAGSNQTSIYTGDLTKQNVTALQEKGMKATDRLVRLEGIMSAYKPQYQESFTRISKSWDSFKSKTGIGKQLTPQDKEELKEYTNYRKQALRDFALEIHELAKGNLTKDEEALYKEGLANPGKGWFDGDSPPEWEQAMKTTYINLKKSVARTNYYLKNGYKPDEYEGLLSANKVMSIDEFTRLADDKAAEFASKAKEGNPNITPQQLKTMVRNFIKEEFGL